MQDVYHSTDSAYFVKSTPLRAFECIALILCRYVTDILQMCMMNLSAEKNIFDKFTAFLT